MSNVLTKKYGNLKDKLKTKKYDAKLKASLQKEKLKDLLPYMKGVPQVEKAVSLFEKAAQQYIDGKAPIQKVEVAEQKLWALGEYSFLMDKSKADIIKAREKALKEEALAFGFWNKFNASDWVKLAKGVGLTANSEMKKPVALVAKCLKDYQSDISSWIKQRDKGADASHPQFKKLLISVKKLNAALQAIVALNEHFESKPQMALLISIGEGQKAVAELEGTMMAALQTSQQTKSEYFEELKTLGFLG